jgi:ATP-dependent DNA ligase
MAVKPPRGKGKPRTRSKGARGLVWMHSELRWLCSPRLRASRSSPTSLRSRQARGGCARGRDGVVAKRLNERYLGGERAMIKVKRLRTADCVIGGFRSLSRSYEVGSLLLGLHNEKGLLDHVRFTSTIANHERPALTRRLHALQASPGFTGRAPGGPSRWSTERSGEWEPVRPDLVVEVRYDHVTGDRFRHGTKLLRWRPDNPPRQCTIDQIVLPPAGLA